MGPLNPTTARDFIEAGWSLSISCSNYRVCSHDATIAMPNLIQHLGWDFDLYAGGHELRRRLTCSVCGKRFPEVRIATTQAGPAGGAGIGSHGVHAIKPYWEALRDAMEFSAKVASRGDISWVGKRGRSKRRRR